MTIGSDQSGIYSLNQAEQALTRKKELNQSLLESMADGVVACDADGILTLFNRTAREWHGMDPLRLPPEEWSRHYDLFRADGITPLPTDEIPLARAFRGELVTDAGMAIKAKGQPIRFILANGSVIEDEAGQKLGAVVILSDITEFRGLEQELRKANEELEQRVAERTKELQQINRQLQNELTGRRRMENALFFVAQRGWPAGAENFFDALAQYLGETLDLDYVVIDRLDENPDIAVTVALYAKGAVVPNIRYPLKGTPCENVMGRKLCVYPQGVQQLFPEDTLLVEMGVESYIGIPLWDASGVPIGLIALMDSKPLVDVAAATQLLQLVATRAAAELARERSDRILQTREHEFRTLANNLPDNIVRYDREGRTVYVNPVLEKTLDAVAADMIGKRVRENHPDGSYEAYSQALDATLASGDNKEFEFVLPIPDKEPIVHQIRMIAERDDHGQVTGVLVIGHDITERKQAEEALRKTARNLNEAQHIAHVGSWELNLLTNQLTWSDEIYRIFEIDPQAFGASYEAFLQAIHPDDREAVNAAYNNSLKTRMPYAIDHRLLLSGGRIKFVQEQCETFYENDRPIRSAGTVQDVTGQRLAEEQLQKLNEELEQRVKERTAELENKNTELERLNKLFVGRELRMVELKEKIRELESKFAKKGAQDA